jgi:protein SCO1
MGSRLRITLLAVATAIAVALAITLIVLRPSHGPSPAGPASAATPDFDGAILPANVPLRDFTLTDALDNGAVSLARYRGQVVVLAFLYSTCGSTCVLIAQQVRGALDEAPRPVPVLFISADPAADTPARVSRFLTLVSLNGRVHYLTGSRRQLARVWRAYGVAPAGATTTDFARAAAVLLLDAYGRERVLFGLDQLTPEALTHDICKLGGCGPP